MTAIIIFALLSGVIGDVMIERAVDPERCPAAHQALVKATGLKDDNCKVLEKPQAK